MTMCPGVDATTISTPSSGGQRWPSPSSSSQALNLSLPEPRGCPATPTPTTLPTGQELPMALVIKFTHAKKKNSITDAVANFS